jgi:hypothetical protein
MKRKWICAFGIFTILCTRASACICFSVPMCAQSQPRGDSTAIFVGRVISVWPSRETIAAQSRDSSLDELRKLILERWQGTLSSEEEQIVRTTMDKDALEVRFGYTQRARFHVTEILSGPRIEEVYSNATSCGFRFEPGWTYLVVAHRNGRSYHTGACSRTSRVESSSAVEDLKALRAWRSDNPLAPRIYGHIDKAQVRQDTRVRLFDEESRERAVSRVDSNGRFAFDALGKVTYRLQVEDFRGKGERLIDLSRLACFEATPYFGESWSVLGIPTLTESGRAPILSDPPPLPAPERR